MPDKFLSDKIVTKISNEAFLEPSVEKNVKKKTTPKQQQTI